MLFKKTIITILCFACTVTSCWIAQAKTTQLTTINQIQAKLFYESLGTFSENIIDNPEFTLWNTIIGEGSAKAPSDSTLVLIALSGEPGVYNPQAWLEVTVLEAGKVKLSKTQHVGLLNKETGRYYAPIWLYDTGCMPITIKAKLLGQGPVSQLTKTIPFRCGE